MERSLLWVLLIFCSVHGAPGQDSIASLQTAFENLARTVDTLQQQVASQAQTIEEQAQEIASLKAANSRKVAFTAAVTNGHNENAVGDSVVPFHHVISNVGNAYNAASSQFTAPYDGVYFFIVNVDVSPDYEIMEIMRNNQVLFYADKDDTVSTHVSGSAVVTLRAGDVISVHHMNRDTGYVEEGLESTFSGFLVY